MATPVSKQERIRLNQQRSRARRQEYLQELEKRVQGCHFTCREADLQRESYDQIKKENLILRSLLGSLGLSDAQIDTHINSSEPSNEQASLRNLRPKIQSGVVPAQPGSVARFENLTDFPVPTNQNMISCTGVPGTAHSCCASTCSPAHPDIGDPSLTISPTLHMPPPQYCQTFLTPYFEPTMGPPRENSILCSQAQDLTDQYSISEKDIQHISRRLVTGSTGEFDPGGGCRVDGT
ncbi:hypothetical protein EPUS_05679 [Endocarpon pusillum Z07020]|uniref:BZIP domain-containing protein n=1 Tax=Endocarpon pusillum (strain Z07020 / HMAS-L-300199) TaxID=1263415 RepID=U1HQE6_ENDPU|nr:uncharacterized protein EPUS_05679 [Endocarpon pusillum Z07020]ERF72625.1 hypothetical protein EPUS_05679 [Endocarpon pusillum Z07020]